MCRRGMRDHPPTRLRTIDFEDRRTKHYGALRKLLRCRTAHGSAAVDTSAAEAAYTLRYSKEMRGSPSRQPRTSSAGRRNEYLEL